MNETFHSPEMFHVPQSVLQFVACVMVIGAGAAFGQAYVLKPLMTKKYNADELAKKFARKTRRPFSQLKDHLHPHIGFVELLIYSGALAFGGKPLILTWFATKYVTSWHHWTVEPIGRAFYNRSLIGSGVNLIVGVAIGGLALLIVKAVSDYGY